MNGYVDSYYSRTAREHVSFDPLVSDIDADIVVIGGGLAGTGTALDLAQRGQKVALLEARKIGWGASGRNGGFATDNFPGGYFALAQSFGIEKARRFHDVARRGLELVESRIQAYSIDCGPLQRGALRCNVSPAAKLRFQSEFLQEKFGIEQEYWSADELREALSTDRYVDAVLNNNAFAVHPLDLTCGMARACAEAGVRVFESSAVSQILTSNGRKTVVTSRGKVRAEKVVIACGGYIEGINRFVSAGTVPLSTIVIVTEPLGDRLDAAIRVPYAISDNTFAVNYYRRLPEKRLLWGGRIVPWLPGASKIAAMLKRDLAAFYPALRDVKVDAAWGGEMPFASHEMPVIGQAEEDVWYLTGFGGLGVSLTGAFGELVAKGIVEADDTWRMFGEFGLPYAGGKLGKVPAQLIYWSHKMRAALGKPVLVE